MLLFFWSCERTEFYNVQLCFADKPQHTRIVAVPDNEVTLNGTVTLRCTAEGNPLVKSFRFYHNLTLIQDSSRNLYRIDRMTESQQGTYTCVPVNDLGDGQNATISIKVGGECKVRLWMTTKFVH